MSSTISRPTENTAMKGLGKYGQHLPAVAVLEVGFCSARAVNDRYGMRLFACAVARKTRLGA